MARKKRETLNQILSQAQPFGGGKKQTIEQEFPQIAELTIEWAQDLQFREDGPNKHIGPGFIPEALDCENWACNRGGIETRPIIRTAVAESKPEYTTTVTCPGTGVGSAHLQRPCYWSYRVRVKIKYKDNKAENDERASSE